MLLLTGATGTIGMPLLRRLTAAAGVPVRCLVRDPRRLGVERVRVQIALGDLADHPSFRHALRGVDTVVHLASVIRDQPNGSIEELAGVATWRLVRAAERTGVERFRFFSALGASTRSRARLMRAKAVAEWAVMESSLTHTVIAPVGRLFAWRPVPEAAREHVAAAGDADLRFRAHAVSAHLGRGRGRLRVVNPARRGADRRIRRRPLRARRTRDAELPRHRRDCARSFGRRRPIVGVPIPVMRRTLRAAELLLGPTAFATWDEAELLEIPMTSGHGTADAERLGVLAKSMPAVLGVG
jgi:uncharacterized protein YbjT (DUF2867 family)